MKKLLTLLLAPIVVLASCASSATEYHVSGASLRDVVAESKSWDTQLCEPFQLYVSAGFQGVEQRLDQLKHAINAIERRLGPFEQEHYNIYLVKSLARHVDGAADVIYEGLVVRYDGVPGFVLSEVGGDEVLIHELAHLRMEEIAPQRPGWLDEGIARYLEVVEGLRSREEMLRKLEYYGITPREQVTCVQHTQGREDQRYATCWALVFALVHTDGLSLQQMLSSPQGLLERGFELISYEKLE